MNRLTSRTRTALTALALLGFVILMGIRIPARAAQPPENLKPFKATLTGPLTPRFVIPTEPEIRLGTFSAEGQSDLLGAVKFVEANTLQMSVDGKALSVKDGVGVITGANGDAIFVTYYGPVTNDIGTTADFAFTVSGGRGQYLGATGSGVIHCAIQPDQSQKTFTRVIEGNLAIPK